MFKVSKGGKIMNDRISVGRTLNWSGAYWEVISPVSTNWISTDHSPLLFPQSLFYPIFTPHPKTTPPTFFHPIPGTIRAQANDVVMVSLDFTQLPHNLTYGDDYQIGVYVDCKPCPTRYR